MLQAGWKMIEVPTTYQARLGGTSKSKLVNMAFYTKRREITLGEMIKI